MLIPILSCSSTSSSCWIGGSLFDCGEGEDSDMDMSTLLFGSAASEAYTEEIVGWDLGVVAASAAVDSFRDGSLLSRFDSLLSVVVVVAALPSDSESS